MKRKSTICAVDPLNLCKLTDYKLVDLPEMGWARKICIPTIDWNRGLFLDPIEKHIDFVRWKVTEENDLVVFAIGQSLENRSLPDVLPATGA